MTITQHQRTASDARISALPCSRIGAAWFAMFAAFAALYALTASRGIQWQDAGFHIVRMMRGELVNPLGLALSHPLHFWLGRAALCLPVLEPAYAVTLVSALAGAVAVANVFGCASTLTGRASAGVVAGCSLGLANTFWQMATIAECNTLTAALLSAELWAIVVYLRSGRRTSLYLAFLFNGLGLANHLQAALTTPLLFVVFGHAVLQRRVRERSAIAALGLWLVGAMPYVGLVVQEIVRSGAWAATIRSAVFGHTYADAVLNIAPSWRQLAIVAAFVLLNFPNLTLPLFVRGCMRRPHGAQFAGVYRYLFAALAIHALFALRYNVVDQHTFFLPTYILVTILACVGFARVMRKPSGRRSAVSVAAILLLVLTPVVYAFVPGVARRAGVLRHVEHEKPYRDDYVYLFVPWTVADRSAERVGREAIELAGDGGLVIVEDPMAKPAVDYERMRTGKSDVDVMLKPHDGAIDEAAVSRAVAEGRPVVLVPLDRNRPAVLLHDRAWARVGDLYVLEPGPSGGR